MKFLHLADLHLGKRVNGFSMLEDQAYILRQILTILDDERPDGVLIAGDVYDKPVPPTEAVELLDGFLTELCARGVPVLLISGNHDSPERLAFGGRVMDSCGVHIAPVYGGAFQVITEEAIGAAFGVESVIARVQTPGHDYHSITPVAVRAGESAPAQPAPEGNRLATVSIIVGDGGDVERVNRALHDCGGSIIGRCGLPYPDRHVRVITVVLDAPQSEIERLAMRINHLHGVSIKTTYA